MSREHEQGELPIITRSEGEPVEVLLQPAGADEAGGNELLPPKDHRAMATIEHLLGDGRKRRGFMGARRIDSRRVEVTDQISKVVRVWEPHPLSNVWWVCIG